MRKSPAIQITGYLGWSIKQILNGNERAVSVSDTCTDLHDLLDQLKAFAERGTTGRGGPEDKRCQALMALFDEMMPRLIEIKNLF